VKPRYLALLVAASAAAVVVIVVAAGRARDDAGRPATQSAPASRFAGSEVPAGLRAPAFSLHDENGRRVTRASLAGRPVVVLFLSTRCRVACLLAANQVKGALDDLRRPAGAVAVSVNPAADTAPAARRLVGQLGMRGRLHFLLGSRRQLGRVWRGFGIDPRRQLDERRARLVLLDPHGRQRVGFPLSQATPERIAHDLRILGAE
jgi:protein SCO1/2